jgi:hypothetical protein
MPGTSAHVKNEKQVEALEGQGHEQMNPPTTSGSDDEFVNFLGSRVERVGDDWCVVATVDGTRRVISRHATRELAEQASRADNASANYDRFQP